MNQQSVSRTVDLPLKTSKFYYIQIEIVLISKTGYSIVLPFLNVPQCILGSWVQSDCLILL